MQNKKDTTESGTDAGTRGAGGGSWPRRGKWGHLALLLVLHDTDKYWLKTGLL